MILLDTDACSLIIRGGSRWRAHLESKGEPIGNMDQMIAAHARSAAIPLVTGNAKRFRKIPGLEILDWV